jgi:HAD superfamily hydrolase (TIGR01509 family)
MSARQGGVRAALFDFDLTLVDSSYAITDCHNTLAGHFGLRQVTRDEIMKVIGIPIVESWIILWGECREEWLDYYRANLRSAEHSGMREFPDARAALGALRESGVKTAVVSNRTNARGAVECVGLEKYFDVIIGLEDVANPKPAPDSVLEALTRLGVPREDACYVGDTDIDMKTAAAAGVRGIGVATGNFGEKELLSAGASKVCENLTRVAETILGRALNL